MEDGRCKLGLRGRRELVELIEGGATLRAAAAALNVAPATAHRWWWRWKAATDAERRSLDCLRARPPVPRSCPWGLTGEQEEAILDARAKTNWGPMRLAFLTGRHRSTIWKVLHRHGVSRQRRTEQRQTNRRYEWAEAGALLHIDAFELPKFAVAGHWATGERAERHKTRRAGKVKVIGVIDDHSRLAYCELHSAENANAVSITLQRAARWFEDQAAGLSKPSCQTTPSATPATSLPKLSTSSAHATSASRPTHPAGTERSSGSSEPSTANGPTAASGPTATRATAPCHRSCGSTTAADHTQPAAADHPTPAFTKTASRTSRTRPNALKQPPRQDYGTEGQRFESSRARSWTTLATELAARRVRSPTCRQPVAQWRFHSSYRR